MNKKLIVKIAIIVGSVVAVLVVAVIGLRFWTKSFSPAEVAEYKKGDLKIEVYYSRPYRKERQIFGKIVPYGEVWRTGANEATEIVLSKDITFGGQALKAGRYALLTIPQEKEWTVIINSGLGQWGAFTYDLGKDVLRVRVPVEASIETVEQFTISFQEKENGVDMKMTWENTIAAVSIQ